MIERKIFISHATVDKNRIAPFVARLIKLTEDSEYLVTFYVDRPAELPSEGLEHIIGGRSFATHPRVKGISAGSTWVENVVSNYTESSAILVFWSQQSNPGAKDIFSSEIMHAIKSDKGFFVSLDPFDATKSQDSVLNSVQFTYVESGANEAEFAAFDSVCHEVFEAIQLNRLGISERKILDLIKLVSADHTASHEDNSSSQNKVRVRRSSAMKEYELFLTSHRPTLAFIGNAGKGKTELMKEVAFSLNDPHFLPFYITGKECESGFLNIILSQFIELNADRNIKINALKAIGEVLEKNDKMLVVIVDAINECTEGREALKRDINILSRFGSLKNIKLIISCRTFDWNYWVTNSSNNVNELGLSLQTIAGSSKTGTIEISNFSSQEFDMAIKKYTQEFKLLPIENSLILELCREPFMLNALAQIYRNYEKIPTYLSSNDLIQGYIENKIPSAKMRISLFGILSSLAEQMLERQKPFLHLKNLNQKDYELIISLVDSGILSVAKDRYISFSFEIVLEFFLEDHIYELIQDTTNIEDLKLKCEAYCNTQLLNAHPALSKALSRLRSDSAQYFKLLAYIFDVNIKGQLVALHSLHDSKALSAEEAGLLLKASASKFSLVRQVAASVISKLQFLSFSALIKELVYFSTDWEGKETAAVALGLHPNSLPIEVLYDLWELSNNFHWRVRRAAGYAFKYHCAKSDETYTFLKNILVNSSDINYKNEHVLCIALASNILNSDFALFDEFFKTSQNAHTKFIYAHYLPKVKFVSKASTIHIFCSDTDSWIRSKMVESCLKMVSDTNSTKIPDMARSYLIKLSHDDSAAVRIRVARGLDRFASEEWAKNILSELLHDTSKRVQYAASISLEIALGDGKSNDKFTKVGIPESVILVENAARLRYLDDSKSETERNKSIAGLPSEEDKYLAVASSIASILLSTFHHTNNRTLISGAIDLIIEDPDESMRWALIRFVELVDDQTITENQKYSIAERLCTDNHFWVRREIAIAIGKLQYSSDLRWRVLLEKMLKKETSSPKPNPEVKHFIEAALR